jgi:hypothetical protein
MVDIVGHYGSLRNRLCECEWGIKRVIGNFRVIENKLETINRSFYLEFDEKIMYNIDTTEVSIRNV